MTEEVTVREVAQFVEREPRSSLVLATLRSTGRLSDRMQLAFEVGVREQGVLSDSADGEASLVVRESAVITGYATPSVLRIAHAREAANLKSRAGGTASVDVSVRESARIEGTALRENEYIVHVRETTRIEGRSSAAISRTALIRETARARGRAAVDVGAHVRESAVLADAAGAQVFHNAAIRESAKILGLADAHVSGAALVREIAGATGRGMASVTHNPVIREVGWISGEAVEEVGDTHAWTADMRNWGMSRYTGYPYESMAGLFAAGDAGVYARGQEDFEAGIETGDANFGVDQIKSIGWVYADVAHDAPLSITVTADVRGQRFSHSYAQMPRNASDTRIVRATIGKGFRSNRYRMKITGTQSFTLNSIEVMLAASPRRI